MNPLRDYFESNEGRLIDKWDHYFEIYERHFSRFVGRKPRVLEIGVSQGGSLDMWSNYFGSGSEIVGLDVDPRCATLAKTGVSILIGDQGDRNFIRSVALNEGPFDIVVDDGGHRMTQQIVSLEELFPAVKPDGVYLVEDLHTSYWAEYRGGLQSPGSFIEHAKRLIDELNGWHLREGRGVTSFTESVNSMTFYDSVLVIEKQPRARPLPRRSGNPSF